MYSVRILLTFILTSGNYVFLGRAIPFRAKTESYGIVPESSGFLKVNLTGPSGFYSVNNEGHVQFTPNDETIVGSTENLDFQLQENSGSIANEIPPHIFSDQDNEIFDNFFSRNDINLKNIRDKRSSKDNVENKGSEGAVDVNVNNNGRNVAVNVGSFTDILSQFGIHFNAKPNGGDGINAHKVEKNKKPNDNANWASFFPFVNVGVNKSGGSSDKVNVNVGGTNDHSLVDVKVENSNNFKHNKDDPHHIKLEKPHPHSHDDLDKKVSVNVGGNDPWSSFVNVKVDSSSDENGVKAAPNSQKKCININVPFVNVILNRGCKKEEP